MKADVVHAVLGWLYAAYYLEPPPGGLQCETLSFSGAKSQTVSSAKTVAHLSWLEYSFNYTAVFRIN